ncbi:hypothetical protein AXG93_3158s1090 [Marchantia polymorpha subsp. ruderalis]|uniref:Uncharacterized protein n=1 Tax=Marchantia polymorpha subsp. ruderalis TaxID=1480154 RepID=A0A176VK56_MARPO|nr:hypothetical protein AXG93_3158s1090 [Marchantia polymorpha subsp. ruderalis]
MEVKVELATREMDSSDEEPKLSREVEDLMQRLEGKGEALTRLSNLRPKFYEVCQEFFPERASLSTITGWQSQVRLRVLEAIGNCNTLEYLGVEEICDHDISKLTDSEWDVVLRAFRSSTILREISLSFLEWSSDTEVESLCLQLGRILSTSSVTHLEVVRCPLTARCFLNLASGLRGNSDSELKYLKLADAWGDLSAVKHVADMINSAPLLKSLRLSSSSSRYKMDEETVGIVSQALIQSSSVKEIILDDGNWGAALLQKALAGDDGNRSIERLHLRHMWGLDRLGMDRLGDCLREILTSNPSLKEVRLENLKMRHEKWHQLGEVIPDNAIEIVRVSLPTFEIDWKSIEALARAASSDVKDPKVELQLIISDNHDEWMLSLNLLGRVLRGEIKSLKSLSIFAGDPLTSGTNQDRMGSILTMNGKSGETSVLKRLTLFVVNKDILKGVWKDLLRCLRGNTSLTHLDLFPSKSVYTNLHEYQLDEESFRDLMELLQVNLTLEEIDVSGTSWQTDGKAAQIEEALKQNRKRVIYMSVFREAKLTFGAAKAGRLFLCGSPRADPNWLTNTFLGELIALGQHFQADDSKSADNTMASASYLSKDGFVSESVFAGLIEEFLAKHPHGQEGVDEKVIEDILINLDLCFKVEDTSQYFIPSLIPEHASTEEQKPQELAWETRNETSQFVGIRIQCQDERTMSLTAAFFPRFQVILYLPSKNCMRQVLIVTCGP